MPTITYTQSLVTVTCWCGISHAIPADLEDYARRSGHSIYCPLGHEWIYNDTIKKKLREAEEALERERNRVKATRDLLAQEERSHAATRGHVTRMKKREAAGVCPCCDRTFRQLARHMKGQHPEYVAEGGS